MNKKMRTVLIFLCVWFAVAISAAVVNYWILVRDVLSILLGFALFRATLNDVLTWEGNNDNSKG